MSALVGRREKPRHEVWVPGLLRTGRGEAQDVEVVDLSEGGCAFRGKTGWLDPGSIVTIRIGSLGPLEATLRWVDGRRVGLEFHRPIYGPVFEHLKAILAGAKAGPERRVGSRRARRAPRAPRRQSIP